MNWVQSALDGCVPIQQVLGFPDMCLDCTRHTRTGCLPFPPGSTQAPALPSPCQAPNCHLLTGYLPVK